MNERKALSGNLAELRNQDLVLFLEPLVLTGGADVVNVGRDHGFDALAVLPEEHVLVQQTSTPTLFFKVSVQTQFVQSINGLETGKNVVTCLAEVDAQVWVELPEVTPNVERRNHGHAAYRRGNAF